ncbi:MAG: hypothetical protein RSB96_02925, partial [Oscillospiraceae bacterium]
MIKIVEPHTKQDLIQGAQIEPLVGAKIISFLEAYGTNHFNIASFWIIYDEKRTVMGSILKAEGGLHLSLNPLVNLPELFDFFNMVGGFFEIFLMGSLDFLQNIATKLGGSLYHCASLTY